MAELSIVVGPPLESEPGLGPLTLPGWFREVTARYTAREALVMDDVRWSYAELWKQALAMARALSAVGVGKDARIGVLMTNRPEWLAATFGASLVGATVVALSTFSTEPELDYLLKASCVSVLLFEPRVLKKDFGAMLASLEPAIAEPGALRSTRFPYLRRLVALDGWAEFLALGADFPAAQVEAMAAATLPTDQAALFFSSGSTARPKGILSSHRGIAIQLWRWARMFGLTPEMDVRTWTPNGFFWSGNFGTAMGATLSAGGCLVLQQSFVPDEALALMEAERVTLPQLWPHQSKQLEEAPNWTTVDLSAMRFVDPDAPLAQHPSVTLTGWREPRWSYGSTETFTITTGTPTDRPQDFSERRSEVLPGNTLKIVDPITGAILPRGSSGEVAVKGPTLMIGYLGVPVEQSFDAEGFFRTGDGGFLDEEGLLSFEGPLSTVIKTGGANVSPLEIDAVLEQCPGIKAVRAVGVPHETLGEMVVACVVPADGEMLDDATVLAFGKERLASYKLPRRILFLRDEDLTVTGSNKIKPAELRKLVTERLAAED